MSGAPPKRPREVRMTASPAPETDRKPPLKVLLCSPRGFCAGVVRAIDTVEQALARYGAPVYVRHEIVHNRYVVESLQGQGRDLRRGARRDSRHRRAGDLLRPWRAEIGPGRGAKAQLLRARRHLSAGHQGASRGRDPSQARPRDRADRPCRPSRGGRHDRASCRRARSRWSRSVEEVATLRAARSRPTSPM